MNMDERVKELGKLTRKKAALQARCANLGQEIATIDGEIKTLASQLAASVSPPAPDMPQRQQQVTKP